MKLTASILFLMVNGLSAQAFADGGHWKHPPMDEATKKAVEMCKADRPAEGQRPTREQMQAFRACVEKNGGKLPEHHFSKKDKAAFEACKAQMPERGSGVKPTEEQRKAFKECLVKNGGKPHHRRKEGAAAEGSDGAKADAKVDANAEKKE